MFAGNRLPGVPERTAFVDLRWRPAERWEAGVEMRHAGRMFVNDANSDAAEAYSAVGLRLASDWRLGRSRVRAFVRVDNVLDRRYAGSVIVNEGNARFFEPAPSRTWLAGVRVAFPD